ncbi:MAG: AraC family transcriptional regulator [Brevundimonas sp.]|nr:MAG: AraC family transcriptional regulator [Brevundimonas sp.]
MKGEIGCILRKTRLLANAEVAVSLVRYPPGLTQPPHEHERPQLSLLLAGGLAETTSRAETFSVRRSSGVKPGGQRHAARFGPVGALMLSLELPADATVQRPGCEWRGMGATERRLLERLLRSERPAERRELALDLASLVDAAPDTLPTPAIPSWLHPTREALDDDPAGARIDELARRAGVHRGHLSRSFTVAYGLPPSLYRARSMAMRSVSLALERDDSLAAVAAEAGFADQSHMARTVRREVGTTVSRLRRLLGDATSVQA